MEQPQSSPASSDLPDLDIEQPEALIAYLRQSGRIGAHETPQVKQLAGGVSSRTMQVTRPTGESWVLKQALSKLRVEADWFSDPRRMRVEATALRWLAVLVPPGAVPAFLFEDPAHNVLAMLAVPDPHVNWKTALLEGHLNLDHVRAFGTLLGAIHSNGYLHRDEIAPDFVGQDVFESLRLEPFYRYTAGRVPAASDFLHALLAETFDHPLTFVHGDFSPKNILIHQDQLVLLDPEPAHFGDPAYDVGFSLTHLLSKAHYLASQRAAFAEAALTHWHTYRQAVAEMPWAADLEPRAVRHTLGNLLARVAGRSPLEYMNEAQRAAQQAATVDLMQHPPAGVVELISEFIARL